VVALICLAVNALKFTKRLLLTSVGPGVTLAETIPISGRKGKASPDAVVVLRGRAWGRDIIIHFGQTSPKYWRYYQLKDSQRSDMEIGIVEI
jgi:hypothetical protein